MDCYWFYTWRTYGTWVPGEAGFVSHYRPDPDGERRIDNVPGEPATGPIPALEGYARQAMRGDAVLLNRTQAETLLAQFHETALYRNWVIDAVAVMVNHIHLVFGVPAIPIPRACCATGKVMLVGP